MTTPEGKVKDFVNRRMKQWFPNAFAYSPPGGRFGKAGMPDRIWFIPSTPMTCIVAAIECKAEGGHATQLQINTLTDLVRCGVVAAIVVGRDEAKMEKIKDAILRRIQLALNQP